ncbi:LA_2444/LA_4059 family outer membrane protein [Leptospira noguchii]|uniref:Outer membrane protein, LA_2444/LA_4059 family n=1 Tax=Leptospira noguchii str. 2001034031 TaxID=1193053 RepID=M6Y925_9LEPT|nr:LA_2444/LA_4059 family outer membrane protein [Leptospira noguchii]EMO90842.1 outer membrane protein, LA_2444/LA_4059 family [Leptospira noguchii str. 2001034031]
MKNTLIYIFIMFLSTAIYSNDIEKLNNKTEIKGDSKKHSLEIFFRLNSGSWTSESLRRESDSNSALGNSVINGYFSSYDQPSKDRRYENPGYSSLGFVYKNIFYKISVDYNYLVFSQFSKINYKYAGIFGSQGMEHSDVGSGFLYDIHPYRVENKIAVTKEIFNNDRFLLKMGGGIRGLYIIRERQYPDFILEYFKFVSNPSTYSNIIKAYGPQISVRSELQIFSGFSYRMNLDGFFVQGNAKYNYEYIDSNNIFISKADNTIQFYGFDFTSEISYLVFKNLRIFIGYELILSKSKYKQYNESNGPADIRTVISSELRKYEYTQDKIDSLRLWYVGAGFIF